jgi:hypothetical protein
MMMEIMYRIQMMMMAMEMTTMEMIDRISMTTMD